MINKKELLNIIYDYYPRNINSINDVEGYTQSKEYKNLLNCIEKNKKPYKNQMKNFLEDIRKTNKNGFNFKDITNFGWQDRCYTLEFDKQINNKSFLNLKIFKSILGPYYLIKTYEIEFLNNRYKYNTISNSLFPYPNFIYDLKQILKKYNLSEIDYQLSKSKINNINFQDIEMKEFTVFNALFC